jgi:hypothetical protein
VSSLAWLAILCKIFRNLSAQWLSGARILRQVSGTYLISFYRIITAIWRLAQKLTHSYFLPEYLWVYLHKQACNGSHVTEFKRALGFLFSSCSPRMW